ncbi:MAG: DUF3368 domain-containing protein [Candidatus Latescibacterota bacterium]
MAQVVADTSPLIALHQIGLLWLFEALYRRVLIPPAVASEVAPSLPALPGFVRVQPLTKPVPYEALGTPLGDGESEAIALALEIGADGIVLDELRGRAVAQRLKLKVVGTLGVLRSAKLSGYIPEVRGPVDALKTARFWVEPGLVAALLSDLGE